MKKRLLAYFIKVAIYILLLTDVCPILYSQSFEIRSLCNPWPPDFWAFSAYEEEDFKLEIEVLSECSEFDKSPEHYFVFCSLLNASAGAFELSAKDKWTAKMRDGKTVELLKDFPQSTLKGRMIKFSDKYSYNFRFYKYKEHLESQERKGIALLFEKSAVSQYPQLEKVTFYSGVLKKEFVIVIPSSFPKLTHKVDPIFPEKTFDSDFQAIINFCAHVEGGKVVSVDSFCKQSEFLIEIRRSMQEKPKVSETDKTLYKHIEEAVLQWRFSSEREDSNKEYTILDSISFTRNESYLESIFFGEKEKVFKAIKEALAEGQIKTEFSDIAGGLLYSESVMLNEDPKKPVTIRFFLKIEQIEKESKKHRVQATALISEYFLNEQGRKPAYMISFFAHPNIKKLFAKVAEKLGLTMDTVTIRAGLIDPLLSDIEEKRFGKMEKTWGQHKHGITPPKIKKESVAIPEFHKAFVKENISGKVICTVHIRSDGSVGKIMLRYVGPIGKNLERSVTDAITQWLYEPARLDGKPLEYYLTEAVIYFPKMYSTIVDPNAGIEQYPVESPNILTGVWIYEGATGKFRKRE